MSDNTALVVEDSLTQAHIISRMLQSLGWTPLHCPTIREASDALGLVSVQAVFLDVFVGPYNGLLHVDRFRKLAPGAPIIIMTAGANHEDIGETLKNARKTEADYVLRKPFTEVMIKDIFEATYQDLSARKRRRHVLVIDDSQTIRSVVSGILEPAGYRISLAESMEQAFENIDIAHVDLVLCDLFMPGMGGFKGIRTIKATWPKVRIISMSAGIKNQVDEWTALNAASKLGADAQISKPFTNEDLMGLVGEFADA